MHSNLGAWEERHSQVKDATPYALTDTYAIAAEFLADCDWVEDWGCGMGWMRTQFDPNRYRGLDGTAGPFVDEVVDLAQYRSKAPGIVMRHVIEHCWDWQEVLGNALASFRKKMALVLFTPLALSGVVTLNMDPALGVPSLSFSQRALLNEFAAHDARVVDWQHLITASEYSAEDVICLERKERS